MRRREFLTVIGGAAAWPLAAHGQQRGKVFRIGVIETVPAAQNSANMTALRQGLRNGGYVEGQNLVIEYRSGDGSNDRFDDIASELVRLNVDLIVTRGTPAVQAAQKASRTIPLVMAAIGAPLLVVDSLRQPGGNVTGMSTFSAELIGKRVELMKELIPNLHRLALIHNLGNPMSPPEWVETKKAANSLGLEAVLFDVRTTEALSRAFEAASEQHIDGLIIGADGLTQTRREMIVNLAARNKLPAAHPSRDFVEIGGLMSYGVSYPDLYLRAAGLIVKIFRGAKPADIPVEQPTRLELVINRETASALGITIPQSILVRSDDIIG